MKRMKFTLGILSLALLSTTFFVSCNNEDETTATTQFQDSEKSTQKKQIVKAKGELN